jgi:long-chain fatty acid transport protein
MKVSRKLFVLTPLCALMAAGSAYATDGYFPIGYGMKAKGMGGTSLTQTNNAFAGANNPAIAAFAGNRVDAGLDVFMPDRGMSRSGSQYGLDASVDSGHGTFWVPEFGYNAVINDKIGAGITVYGNGGMNTDYPGGQINCGQGPANVLCGSGNLGINMSQLIFAPTIAYKLNPDNAIGLSLLFVYQQFGATGLQAFSQASLAPTT